MAIPDDDAEQDAAIASVLGAPARVAIIRALAGAHGPLSLNALAAMTHLDSAVLAQHLAAVVAAGAVTRTQDEGESYRVAKTAIGRTVAEMFAQSAARHTARLSDDAQSAPATLDAVLEQMASGVAVYDAAGVLIRLNTAGGRITQRAPIVGETQSARLARYAMRRIDGTILPVEESPSGRALAGEVVTGMECIIDGQHGHDTWLRCSAAPLRDERGAIQGAVVVFDDITEQRALAQMESEQRALAAAMIEHTFSGMAIFDATDAFHCIQHNDNFLRLLGDAFTPRGSIVGLSVDALFVGEIGPRIRAIYEQVRSTGEPYFNNEFSAILPADQRRHWYRFRLMPLRDEHGTVNALLAVVFEVTKLVAARKELSAIIEAMPEAVMLSDKTGRFTLSNAAAARILGYQVRADVPFGGDGETFRSFSVDGRPLEVSELPMMRALRGETVIGEEIVYQRPDGRRLDLLTSSAPVDIDDSGQIADAVSVFQDITRLKELERQRDDFLGIAAHELRTPLATILATLQTFLRRLQRNPTDTAIPVEALASGLERMYRQSQRLNKLVSDLLDTTRIRTETLDYDLEPCDLAAVVRDTVAGQIAAHPGRKIALTVQKRPVLVIGDGFRLSQVVDNLVVNALKYSPEAARVSVDLKIEGGMACLRVIDRGVGIPSENLDHLFERFYRVPGIEVQSGAGVGLGLGLHITHRVVERHGGHIEVQSVPGKGSTFLVTLPLLDSHQRDSDSAAPARDS